MLKKIGTKSFCHQCSSSLFTVIVGSYRKHLQQIIELKKILESCHIVVLSPSGEAVANPDAEFIILDSDPISHPKLLQNSVFAKIRRSSFLVVANVEGYLGCATILEIGYAICLGIDIYTLEPIEDPNLSPYCRQLSEIFPNISLSQLEKRKEVEFVFEPALPKRNRIQKLKAK